MYTQYWDVSNLNYHATKLFTEHQLATEIYGEKTKLCYVSTDSFIVYIKTNDTYKNIAEDVETRSDTWNYELDRPLPKAKKIKKWLMKDEQVRKIMAKFVGLRAKTFSYLKDDGSEDKKGIYKKRLIKKNLCLKIIKR